MDCIADDRANAAARAGPAWHARAAWRRVVAAVLAGAAALAALPVAFGQAVQPLMMVEQGSHSAPVRRIDVDRARGIVVTASDDRTARVWDLSTGELRHVLRPLAFGAEGGRLYGVALHPTQPLVAVGGTTGGDGHSHTIYLFNIESGALAGAIDARGGHVRKLAWSSDGTVLLAALAGDNGVKAFSFDGALLLAVPMPAPVFGLTVSPHGLAAAAALDGSVHTFRVGAGAITPLLRHSMGIRRAAGLSFSPDGRRLAIAFADATVGANGRESLHEALEIIDAESGRSLSRLAVVPMFGGDLRVVAWSPDGQSIFAGGTAYTRDHGFPIVQYDVASGRAVAVSTAAGDSVTDLLALPDGTVAFSSFDGSWGLMRNARVVQRVAPAVTVVRGGMAQDLELSADGRSVRWGMRSTAAGKGFQFAQRQVGVQVDRALRAPETSFSVFNRPSDWNLSRGTPIVGGKPLAMAPDERPRALAVVRATKSALVGTNRGLYKLDDQGNLSWRSAVDTEVRAVNASDDGRWVVTAMADGTLRWWRGRDGAQLLTLLVAADGRWVVWTPAGYYDASAGADRLVGWALAQGASKAMDFYSVNRFRERFNRPDVIDALLETLDLNLALDTLRARDLAAQEQARNEAAALQRQAAALARAADEALQAWRQAERRDAQVRLDVERAVQEAAAKAAAAREADAKRLAAREAEREAAQREAALRQAEAREAAEREAAQQRAAQEAQRTTALLAAQREAAAREASAREAAATLAAAEASAREAAIIERKALAIVKALEVPPALSAPEAKRIQAAAPEVTLQFAVASSGQPSSLLLEVRVNGRPAQPSELVLPKSLDGAARGFAKLALDEGESLVEILARNAYGVSEPLSFKIERTVGTPSAERVLPRPSGDLFVLAIGVSDYVRSDYRLGLAAKDAQDFANTLRQQEGKQYRKVHVRVLANRDATRASILREFEWLRQSASPTDVAMLFMAGHGLNDALGQYYFLPADGQHERLAATALPQGVIVSTLSKVRGKTLLFLDTCFAGASLGALSKVGRQTEKMMNDLSSSENGVVVFASSTGQDESEEKAEWGNGAFTKVLIEGLAGKADFTRVGQVTFAALNLFLSEGVARLTQGRQRPVFISPRGIPDFALVRL
jgi:WD40 repeat protein